jgi:DNA repair exonuclease SbcCD ATPase subunit
MPEDEDVQKDPEMDNEGDKEAEKDEEVSDEEADKKLAELEEKAKRAEELEKELAEKEEQLAKLSGKELNFKKFRESTKAEKDEMLKKYNEKEKMLVEKMSEIEGKLTATEQARMDEAKDAFLDGVGADDDLKKRLELGVKESIAFYGEPKTPQELRERYQKAYTLLKGESAKVNPLNKFVPTTTHIEGSSRKRFTDTQQGRSLLKDSFGIDLDKK